ncbi:MAG TPA: hypothetical protein PKW95_14735 [bacterium]|mgnify:CR=1 FL=1|nr:hypothetical protein [bacterium]
MEKITLFILLLLVPLLGVLPLLACGDDDDDDDDDSSDDDDDSSDDDDDTSDDDEDDDSSDDDIDDDSGVNDDIPEEHDYLNPCFGDDAYDDKKMLLGGATGIWDTDLAYTPDGAVHVAAVRERALCLYTREAGKDEWSAELIDRYAQTPELKVDGDGNLHLVWLNIENNNLKYAVNSSGGWAVETVVDDGSVDVEPALVIDNDGRAHIAHLDIQAAKVKYSTNAGGNWATVTVDDTRDTYYRPALAVDEDGHAYLSYTQYTGDYDGILCYADNTGGGWAKEEVLTADGVSGNNALTVDDQGAPHLAFVEYDYDQGDQLKHAWKQNGSWSFETVYDETELYSVRTALQYTTDGTLLLVMGFNGDYGDYEEYGAIHLARLVDGNWSMTRISAGTKLCQDFGFVLDAQERPAFAYYDGNRDALVLNEVTGKQRSTQIIDLARNVYVAAGVLDADDLWRLAYVDYNRDQLIYAYPSGGDWHREVVLSDIGWDLSFVDLAVDAAGVAHICYTLWVEDWPMYYATNADGDWQSSLLAEDSSICAIALDGDGHAHIGYEHMIIEDGMIFGGDLRYATNQSGDWQITDVYTNDASDYFVDIALDEDENAHLAFSIEDSYGDDDLDKEENDPLPTPFDRQKLAYKIGYATNAGGSWNVQEITNDGEAGDGAIDVDADGHAHIGFFDVDDCKIRYATNQSGDWVLTDVYPVPFEDPWIVYWGTSLDIAVNDVGETHMSFCDYANNDLMHAVPTDAPLTLERLDSAGDIGFSTRIGFSSEGETEILYNGLWGIWLATVTD